MINAKEYLQQQLASGPKPDLFARAERSGVNSAELQAAVRSAGVTRTAAGWALPAHGSAPTSGTAKEPTSARAAQILGHQAAIGRRALAEHLANHTATAPDAAIRILAAAARTDDPPGSRTSQDLQQSKRPTISTDIFARRRADAARAATGGGPVARRVNRPPQLDANHAASVYRARADKRRL